MRSILTLFILGVVWAVYAEAGATRYDTLREMATDPNGYTPSEQDLTGFWAGRCFSQQARDTQNFAVLTGIQFIVEPDAGPQFPAKTEFRTLLVSNLRSEPERFSDAQKNEWLSNPNFRESCLATRINWLNDQVAGCRNVPDYLPENYSWGIRLNNGYMIAWLDRNAGRTSTPIVPADPNDADFYCYFFLKFNPPQ